MEAEDQHYYYNYLTATSFSILRECISFKAFCGSLHHLNKFYSCKVQDDPAWQNEQALDR